MKICSPCSILLRGNTSLSLQDFISKMHGIWGCSASFHVISSGITNLQILISEVFIWPMGIFIHRLSLLIPRSRLGGQSPDLTSVRLSIHIDRSVNVAVLDAKLYSYIIFQGPIVEHGQIANVEIHSATRLQQPLLLLRVGISEPQFSFFVRDGMFTSFGRNECRRSMTLCTWSMLGNGCSRSF